MIGNARFAETADLKNPENDAQDVAERLKELGWSVSTLLSADKRSMLRSAVAFREALRAEPGSSALFFYAGHGMQFGGENFLVPVDSQILSEDDIRGECLPLNEIQAAAAEGGAGITIMILDACRDNPFATKKTRGSQSRGLTVIPATNLAQTAVIFATSPNDVAQDGEGRNRVFTEAFLAHLVQSATPLSRWTPSMC